MAQVNEPDEEMGNFQCLDSKCGLSWTGPIPDDGCDACGNAGVRTDVEAHAAEAGPNSLCKLESGHEGDCELREQGP